jgi:hypothetical protein
MALGALFYDNVTNAVTLVLLVAFVVIELFAFVNCLTQRADAFPVVGSLSKPGWLAILGGSVLLTLLCRASGNFLSIFGLAAITAAAIYLLDVRPALRDATDGTGPW